MSGSNSASSSRSSAPSAPPDVVTYQYNPINTGLYRSGKWERCVSKPGGLYDPALHAGTSNCWSNVGFTRYAERRAMGGTHRTQAIHPKSLYTINNKEGNHHMYQKDVKGHYGCVNSVEFSVCENLVVSGGDDLRVVVWRTSDIMMMENPRPLTVLSRRHAGNVFAGRFSLDCERVYSGGNDGYMIAHDLCTNTPIFDHNNLRQHGRNAVHHISQNPIDNNVIAATRDNGTVSFYDMREGYEPTMTLWETDEHGMPLYAQYYSGQYSPANALLFAVACNSNGPSIYDLRMYTRRMVNLEVFVKSCMFAEWNPTGTALAVVESNGCPHYIDIENYRVVKLRDDQYSNRHTCKSINFMDDKTIVTGSDSFNIFAWTIPDPPDLTMSSINSVSGILPLEVVKDATTILRGHRSICNHVKYSSANKIMLSVGVEKIIKCWSHIPIAFHHPPKLRDVKDYRGMIQIMGLDQDEDEENEDEDIRMLLYFDGISREESEDDVSVMEYDVHSVTVGEEMLHFLLGRSESGTAMAAAGEVGMGSIGTAEQGAGARAAAAGTAPPVVERNGPFYQEQIDDSRKRRRLATDAAAEPMEEEEEEDSSRDVTMEDEEEEDETSEEPSEEPSERSSSSS